ncbi:MAG TPA: glycosyl hydrolase [Polyangiales bacterium]
MRGWLALLLFMGCSEAEAKHHREPMLGVYVGNDPSELPKFERWLGRAVDGHQVHTGNADWDDWQNSIPWQIELWKDTDRPIFWSIPLIPKGATLEQAARGEYDDRYSHAAQEIANASSQRERVFIRTGWEFNAEWQHPCAIGKADRYVAAYRHFVQSFRAVSRKFVFEWTPNHGDHGMNPETAYPGDKYVDIIGMDFYYDLRFDPKDPLEAWKGKVYGPYGLDWLEKFAKKHRKPTAYAEWGVMSDGAGPYVREAAKWFRHHDVVYQSYWNSNDAYTGKLSDGAHEHAGAAYRESFKGR